jgi:hypothetical protein
LGPWINASPFIARRHRLALLLMRASRDGMNCPAGKIRNTLYFKKNAPK